MKNGRKAVWSIPYVYVDFFPSLNQNFIAYRSSKVSDCIFEIHLLRQSGFSRGYSNSCNRVKTERLNDIFSEIKKEKYLRRSILLYGCTTSTLSKRLEKKLDSNYTRVLRAILNKSWRQYPASHQLYGHMLPITKTIQVRRTKHAGHCGRSKDELISDVLLWTPTYGRAKAGWPAQTYI